MTYLFLFIFVLIFIIVYVYTYLNRNKEYADIEENALEIKKQVCLNKTNNFIGIKVGMLCYYNFYFYADYLYMERVGYILFGELPIRIKKTSWKSLLFSQTSDFILDNYKIDKQNIIKMQLRNEKNKYHKLELRFQKQEKEIENWLTRSTAHNRRLTS